MTLALEKRIIPPNIYFDTPNPNIPFGEYKLTVPVEPMPWPTDRLERVGVNSFGVGGANAHVLLESATSFGIRQEAPAQSDPSADVLTSHLVVFSAKHPESLRRSVENHKSYLARQPQSLRDMSWSLATKREKFAHRAFAVAHDPESFELSRTHNSTTSIPREVVFCFSGQGAQWAQMGRELVSTEHVFRETLQRLDGILAQSSDPPEWTLLGTLLFLS